MQWGRSIAYINQIENKDTWPQPEMVDKIAEILGIPPSALFREDGCPENKCAQFEEAFGRTCVLEKHFIHHGLVLCIVLFSFNLEESNAISVNRNCYLLFLRFFYKLRWRGRKSSMTTAESNDSITDCSGLL